MNEAQILAALQQVPHFRNLAPDRLAELARRGRRLEAAAGSILFRAGDAAEEMYLVLSGRVSVFVEDASGVEVELGQGREGYVFGELALLDGKGRSASIRVLDDSVFFTLDRQQFLDALTSSREAVGQMLSVLTSRTREITEQISMKEMRERELRADMEIERYRSLSQMVAGVAHELGTPLGIIMTASDVLRERVQRPALQSLLQREAADELQDILEATALIATHVSRAHQMVLSFKKLAAGQLDDHQAEHDIVETIREIIGMFRISARRAGLEVALSDELRPEERRWRGSSGHLSQVLLNLLTNAARYAYPGGERGRIELRVDMARPQRLRIRVRDHGAGIAAEDLPHVWEPFFTTGRDRGGTGLGLAIVRTLVTGPMRGEVALTSAPGAGVEVTLILPVSGETS